MNRTGIQLVCFDLGGVLVELSNGWPDACVRAGIPVPASDPGGWEKHLALLQQFELGEIDEETYIGALPACLPGIPVPHVLRAFDAFILGVLPGIPELIEELIRRRIRTAILSNTNHRHWRAVVRDDPQYAPLLRIDQLFASHELGAAKPDLRAYRAVESAARIPASSILFFDDRDENIQGARAAGWNAEKIEPAATSAQQIRAHLARYRVL